MAEAMSFNDGAVASRRYNAVGGQSCAAVLEVSAAAGAHALDEGHEIKFERLESICVASWQHLSVYIISDLFLHDI
jgi:hypothetical protein